MKRIGLIGGLSWHSTALYYQQLNQLTANKLGGLNSADINLISLNFSLIAPLIKTQSWDEISKILIHQVKQLESSGMDGIMIANNTLHQLLPTVEQYFSGDFLNIVDALGEQLAQFGQSKVGLLGTASTMSSTYYRKQLLQKFNVEVITPSYDLCMNLDEVIFSELCHGKVTDKATKLSITILEELKEQGVTTIVLACTELPMLYGNDNDISLTFLDSSLLHCQYAVNWSLDEGRK